MRVILDLDEIVLGKLQFKADGEKRSRKNYMELILQNAANSNSLIEKAQPIIEKTIATQVGIQDQITKTEPQQPLDRVYQYCQEIHYATTRKEIENIVSGAKKGLGGNWKDFLTVQNYAAEMIEKKGFIYNN